MFAWTTIQAIIHILWSLFLYLPIYFFLIPITLLIYGSRKKDEKIKRIGKIILVLAGIATLIFMAVALYAMTHA